MSYWDLEFYVLLNYMSVKPELNLLNKREYLNYLSTVVDVEKRTSLPLRVCFFQISDDR